MPNIIRNHGFEDPSSAGSPIPEWDDIEHAELVSVTGPDGSASCVQLTALRSPIDPEDPESPLGPPEGQMKQRFAAPRKYSWSDLVFWVQRHAAGPSFLNVNVVYLGFAEGDPDEERNIPISLAAEPIGEWVQKRARIVRNGQIRRIKIEFRATEGDYCYLDNLYLNGEDRLWYPSFRRPPDLFDREIRRFLRQMMEPSPWSPGVSEGRMAMLPGSHAPLADRMLSAISDRFEGRLDDIEDRLDHIYRLMLEQRYPEVLKQDAKRYETQR